MKHPVLLIYKVDSRNSRHLNLLQYHGIDVIGFLILVHIFFIYAVIYLFSRIRSLLLVKKEK